MMSTVGVRTVIRMGGGPAQIPDEFVDSLQAREVDGLIALPSTPFEVGQKIRLKGGPMEGIVADIIELRDSDRVVVLMDLLRQPVKVQVSADMIVPA